MYLVDTSVWIDYLKGRSGEHVQFLDTLLENNFPIGINELIYMEILQGCRDQASFKKYQQHFSTQTFYRFEDSLQGHEAAAQLYFECRRKGITLRSSVDCLIAQCAIEHNLTLLHHDRDYEMMASTVKALQHKHFLPRNYQIHEPSSSYGIKNRS